MAIPTSYSLGLFTTRSPRPSVFTPRASSSSFPPQTSGLFPATYRAPLKNRVVPMLWIAPLYILAMFGRGHLRSTSSIPLWLFALAGFALIMVSCLSLSFCKIILYADRIERRTWFSTKEMKRSDAGQIRKHGHGLMILSYKYNKGEGIVMPLGIGGDAAWKMWMAEAEGSGALK